MTQTWRSFSPGEAPFLQCWYCSAPLKDHHYADVGSAVPGSKEQDQIDGFISYHEWSPLPFAKATPGAGEVVVFRALRCPSSGGSVAPLILAQKVEADDMIAGTLHMLTTGEIAEITRAGYRWRPYPSTWAEREGGR